MEKREEGLLYSYEHMWIRRSSDSEVIIGITDYAQNDIGEIVFIELPETGKTIKKGDEFGAMESVKTVEPMYAPVSGTVIQCNSSLSGSPEMMNSSPYADGWIAVIELDDPSELDALMDIETYNDHISKV